MLKNIAIPFAVASNTEERNVREVAIIREEITRIRRSPMKGNINVVIDIEGEAPKGMIKKMQDLLAEYNSTLQGNDYISHEIRTHRNPKEKKM